MLLVIETDLLDVPVVEEEVPGTGETFPHLYGPLRAGRGGAGRAARGRTLPDGP